MKCALHHVFKSYGGKAVLKDFCFEAEEGGCYVLTGRSGCGKTTALRILTGLEEPDAGMVSAVSYAGTVFQEERFAEDASALENVNMILPGALLKRTERLERDRMIRSVLLEILREDCVEKPVRELSGGMRRRAAIVRAVMSPADVLIMDEPLAGLDPKTREDVIGFLEKHIDGRTFIAASHEAEELPFCMPVSVVYI